MASYDSDDSLDEGNEYTETDVLLGFASKDSKGETISRLGGRPEWLDSEKPPTATLARCKTCKDLMVLLMQLNAELPDQFPGHERRLYVFSCRRKSCRRKEGSIRAIRGVRISKDAAASGKADKEELKQDAKPVAAATTAGPGLGEALFGVKPLAAGSGPVNPFSSSAAGAANPFAKASSPAAGGNGNPFSTTASKAAAAPETKPAPAPAAADPAKDLPKTFAETLSLNKPQPASGPPPPPEPWPAESEQPKAYPVMYLSEAEYETLDPIPLPVAQATTTLDLDEGTAGGGSSGGKEDKVVFESSMDAAFQKFADRVGQNPEQCIRYEFGGQPLLYSRADEVGRRLHEGKAGMPRCGSCGAARVFEVQMTPQAIAELEAEEEGLEGMDWGTIIVGVCERDCQARGVGEGEAGYLEEWAGVQWEELMVKR
ncbi:PDCD2 C terminal domain-containing protein [Pleurostoma richardsiae]|uniref:PDCD2 C terminal domain-containing protein n=1 Tax=Pleurostoma richardsiae TaxID=41990 RepID=A0AA38RUG1_9PEZI|nr:PDCD2 C terminal domain-containing protein [Pleurostoma richardsiae]